MKKLVWNQRMKLSLDDRDNSCENPTSNSSPRRTRCGRQLSLEMYIVHPKALFIPVDVAKFKLLFVFVRLLLLRLLNMLHILNVTKLCMFLLMLENNPYNYCYLFQNHGIRRCLCE